MATRATHIERYYDTHDVEGAELTQSIFHFAAIEYLLAVLGWLFHSQKVGVVSNINFYQTSKEDEVPQSPDIAIVDGLEIESRTDEDKPSYYIGEDGPPPRLVIEVSSKKTWKADLFDKPATYAGMGINEYFTFDPNLHGIWTRQWRKQGRLLGWRLDRQSGQYRELEKDEAGRIWSEELQSWLAAEGHYLKLYDETGQLRLTQSEVLREQNRLERLRVEKLAERLRQLGENPDEIV